MKTTYLLDAELNHVFRNSALSSPTTVYVGLLTAVTNARAGTVTEANYAGYARKAVTFAAPGAGLGGRFIQNSGAVLFDKKTDAGSVNVIALGIYDASSGGNLLEVQFLDGADPVAAIVDGTGVTNNTLAASNHGLANDQQVRLERQPGLQAVPTGLAEDTTYFVVGTANDTFQLAATQGGAAIDITGEGGVLVHRVTPVALAQNDQANFDVNAIKLYRA
jgi:hypothetical protein